MAAKLIDGKKIASKIRYELQKEIETLKKKKIIPGLATILIGDNPASVAYVRMKGKACDELGIYHESVNKPSSISLQELIDIIHSYENDSKIDGILVQLPLPNHIDECQIIRSIPVNKDVDGFHPINLGKMLLGQDTFLPCTPAGIQELLVRSGHNPDGKHVVIVGRSNIVGMPLANLLLKKKKGANATVTICHTGTRNIAEITRQADILIAAAGKAEMITADMVDEKSIVIDVGTNRIHDPNAKNGYRLVGDVHFTSVFEKVKAISPVPGGVGPMTITMLLKNTVKSAQTRMRQ